jgi:hypothetical protein
MGFQNWHDKCITFSVSQNETGTTDMKNNFRRFRPSTSWTTTLLLTLTVATFGIFAQTQASERGERSVDEGETLLLQTCGEQAKRNTRNKPFLNY